MGIAAALAADDLDWHAALAALAWQVEAGVTEAIAEAPGSAYDLAEAAPAPRGGEGRRAPAPPPAGPAPVAGGADPADPVAAARAAAAGAGDIAALHAALAAFPHCELRRGARNTVLADGDPAARVMVVGEAPGREEDIEGRPFVGPAGRLLDRMFAAIGLSRTSPDPARALYITNVVVWRPPQNRDPEPGEVAMMLPFLARHVELADPEVIVIMGNTPLYAATGEKGILRRRGQWLTAFGRPALAMTHPAYLLRNPAAKREAWADLLALSARLAP